MAGVLSRLSVQGKSVLTVLGSGDQALDFYWAGAREVVGFDITRLASYVCELKFAALRRFDREPYLRLLLELQEGLTAQGKRAFAELLPDLTPTAGRWLAGVLENGGEFKVRSRSRALLCAINPYLQSDADYLRTRERARPGLCVTADLFQVAERFNRRFDVVYLANVLDFNRADAAAAVAHLWPLVEPSGCIASYEFASHPRREGEYGSGTVERAEFKGPI